MNGVETQRIDVVISNPFESIRNEEIPHLITEGIIEIESRTPWRFVALGEVRSKTRQIISFRADMVVHDILHYGQSMPVACVNESFQPGGSAIRVLNRSEESRVGQQGSAR